MIFAPLVYGYDAMESRYGCGARSAMEKNGSSPFGAHLLSMAAWMVTREVDCGKAIPHLAVIGGQAHDGPLNGIELPPESGQNRPMLSVPPGNPGSGSRCVNARMNSPFPKGCALEEYQGGSSLWVRTPSWRNGLNFSPVFASRGSRPAQEVAIKAVDCSGDAGGAGVNLS